MSTLTDKEKTYCHVIAHRIGRLRQLLATAELRDPPDPKEWYQLLSAMKAIQGNLNNDLSFVRPSLLSGTLKRATTFSSLTPLQRGSGRIGTRHRSHNPGRSARRRGTQDDGTI